jgi:hypothetical protein
MKDNKIVLKGFKNKDEKAWKIDLIENANIHEQNISYATYRTENNQEKVAWMHASMGSPPMSSMINAVKKGWLQYPHLTKNILEHVNILKDTYKKECRKRK